MQATRSVAFLVNGLPASAMGARARGLTRYLGPRYAFHLIYRTDGPKWQASRDMYRETCRVAPDMLYVLDMAISGVTASLSYRFRHRLPLIVDTGDAITALARSANLRGPVGLAATWLLETVSLRMADHIVVRGSYHAEHLSAQGVKATFIPDGYEKELFFPEPPQRIGRPDGELTVGLLGSVIWNGNIQSTYGADLIDLLSLVPDLPLRGLLIGGGSGLDRLKQYAIDRGVAGRIEFTGPVAYEELRSVICRMDIALSTQTNDLPGQVRTTGKLPLYLACGRFILASRVGQAARVLPDSMLVEYVGSRDIGYTARLAARLNDLVRANTNFEQEGRELARRVAPQFEYAKLGANLVALLDSL